MAMVFASPVGAIASRSVPVSCSGKSKSSVRAASRAIAPSGIARRSPASASPSCAEILGVAKR